MKSSLTNHKSSTRKRRPQGLTLIELVMVLVILTALAALIVPQVDFLRQTSDKATGSFTIGQVVKNLGMYRTMKGRYPDHLDSLIESGGVTKLSSLDEHAAENFTVVELTEDEEEGLHHSGIGHIFDHDITLAYRGNPGNSGRVDRHLEDAPRNVCVLTPGDGEGYDIMNSIFPPIDFRDQDGDGNTDIAVDGTVIVSDDDEDLATTNDQVTARIVVLGVGPQNDAVGVTMAAAPMYQSVDAMTTYNRYMVMFAVYTSGAGREKPVQLKGALTATSCFLNEELLEIEENEPQ